MIHAFTSITSNYLPKARVLAHSLKRYEPDIYFHLVLSDQPPPGLDLAAEPFDALIRLEDLPISEREAWIFMHSVVELCTAVKGPSLVEILRRHQPEAVFYFDPDIVLCAPLDDLRREFERFSLLLTPHQAQPEVERDSILDNEICSLRHGVYNLGFLGVKNSEEGRRFADWWADRLLSFCYDNIPEGLFTDQRWVDLAPAFFREVGILRDPQYNVATWNLTHRRVTGTLSSGLLVNDRPLNFYHFSGFDSGAQKTMLDKYGGGSRALYELREWYIKECLAMGQGELGQRPCVYDFFDNGERITREQRLLYRSRPDVQRAFPHPRATSDINRSYYHWYRQEVKDSGQYLDGLDTLAALRAEVGALRRELNLIKGSRSWRLARAISSLFQPFRRR